MLCRAPQRSHLYQSEPQYVVLLMQVKGAHQEFLLLSGIPVIAAVIITVAAILAELSLGQVTAIS